MAGVMLVVGDMGQTVVWADRAGTLGAANGLQVPARALGFRGSARCALGDPAGLEELRAALALSLDRGEGRDAAVLYNNLGDALLPVEGPASVLAVYREGIGFAERRGISEFIQVMRSASLDRLIELGAWDRALADATAMVGPAEAAGDVFVLLQLRTAQVRVLVGRGRAAEARPLADWLAGRPASPVGARTSSSPSPPPRPRCWPPASRAGPSACSARPPTGPTSARRRCTRPAFPRWCGRPRTPATSTSPVGWPPA
jgi:hypothetical protein